MEVKDFFEKYDLLLKSKGIPEAEQYALSSLEEANQVEDRSLFISIANELGGLYRVTGRFKAGKVVYHTVLEYLEEMGMKSSAQYATSLINLASVCCEAKEYDEAVSYYLQAEEIYQRVSGVTNYQKATLYNNISSALGAQKKYSLALAYANDALNLIEQEPKAFTERATTQTALGSLYLRMKDYPKAEEHLLKAQEIFTQRSGVKANVHYSQTLNALGELYFVQEKYELARKSYDEALSMVKETYGAKSPVAENISAKLEKIKGYTENKKSNFDLFSQTIEKSENLSLTAQSSYGMNLSENYYYSIGKPVIEEKFPEYLKYIAVGLVGEGSECLGFDDEFSKDHDFGPGFCIWLPEEIYSKIGNQLQEVYDKLPQSFKGEERKVTADSGHRVGVFSIENFYHQYVGQLPKTNIDWLKLPSSHLLTATNGKIFEDNYGKFTKIRQELLEFYPEDVRLKKLAASLFKLSQSGQYNYERCLKRKDIGAAYMSCNEFVQGVLASTYLLNRQYMPYYKWTFRGLKNLERLSEIKEILEQLIASSDHLQNGEKNILLIERICRLIRKELAEQDLSALSDDFLVHHCSVIMEKIKDPQIKGLPIMFDLGD